ncbi:MAG: hypothetical protein DWI48_00380 [Chloroflexi bacterium]|nr:MAG: hypothetical protein DWI48_00380 [Chloroflexota bacterium]
MLTLACGAVRQPVRNPLAEPSASVMAPGTTVPPIVTTVPVPRGDRPPTSAEVEPAAARAAGLMAEWLAVPQREVSVAAAEAVLWPSSCLGVAQPGVVCAAQQVPGFKVLLRDGLGGVHAVHLAADGGGAKWAGETTGQGQVVSLDYTTRRVTVSVNGSQIMLRLVAGTLVDPKVRVGVLVVAAYDPPGSATALPTAAWIVPVS